jgi:hypothetical protein
MRFRVTRYEEPADPPDQRKRGSIDPFRSERWPRTPRVIRWAWASGMTVLVAVGALGGQDPEARLMIRLMHRLIEALDESEPTPPAPPAPSGSADQQAPAVAVPLRLPSGAPVPP